MLRDNCSLWSQRLMYFIIVAIPFASSISSAMVDTLICFGALAYIIRRLALKEYLPSYNSILLPFLLIMLVSFLSFFNSVKLIASWGGIIKLLKYGIIFLIVGEGLADRKHLKRVVIAIILGLYLASLNAVHQLYFGVDFIRHRPYDCLMGLTRVKSSFPHTNIFAAYLALFLPVSIAVMLYYLKGKKKVLLGLLSAVMVYCLIYTFSRGAAFGFLAALIFMGIARKDKLLLGLLVIALLIAPFVLPSSIRDWAKNTDSIWEFLLNKERPVLYKTSLNMIKKHPILGVGVNTFILNYQKYKVIDPAAPMDYSSYYAHNIFLQIGAEIGLVGLLLFLWLLFRLFRDWAATYKRCKDSFMQVTSLGIITGILACLINGLTETTLYYPKIATLFWFQLGLFLGISRLVKEK